MARPLLTLTRYSLTLLFLTIAAAWAWRSIRPDPNPGWPLWWTIHRGHLVIQNTVWTLGPSNWGSNFTYDRVRAPDYDRWWPSYTRDGDYYMGGRSGKEFGWLYELVIPLWIPLLATGLPATLLWRTALLCRHPRGHCPHCGYDLATLPTCPECGRPRSSPKGGGGRASRPEGAPSSPSSTEPPSPAEQH